MEIPAFLNIYGRFVLVYQRFADFSVQLSEVSTIVGVKCF